MYLVDTNVISTGAPSRQLTPVGLAEWMDRNSSRLYLSAMTVAEIEDGIAKLRREGGTRKAGALAEWLDALLHLYSDRILPFDLSAARIAGAFSDLARGRGRSPGFPDLGIAATARSHGLTILTRNLKDFEVFGVPLHNPFDTLPD